MRQIKVPAFMNHESTIHFLCARGRPHLPGIFLAQQLRKFKSKLLNYIIWFIMGDRHIEFLCIACGGFVRVRRCMVLMGFVYNTFSSSSSSSSFWLNERLFIERVDVFLS